MEFPPVMTEADLLTAPIGLYRVGARLVGGDGVRVRDTPFGKAYLFARVRDNTERPTGLDSLTVRVDGKQILTQWVVGAGPLAVAERLASLPGVAPTPWPDPYPV